MKKTTKNKDLIQKIKEAAFLRGEFTTRAGKKTNYYIDKYLFETDPEILEEVCEEIKNQLPPLDQFDRLGAPALGAVALAAVVSLKINKPYIIIQKKSAPVTNRLVGEVNKNDRLVVLEDVLTTGMTVIETCDYLTSEELNVIKIISVIDRQDGATDKIRNLGYDVSSLITRDDLFNIS